MTDDTRGYLTHALRILDETGTWIRERTRSSFTVDRKADDSFVTEIDLEVERRVRHAITSRWPEHSVLGEETGTTEGSSDFRWIIDPIDGTSNFIHGIPHFSISIAVEDPRGAGGRPEVTQALVYQPLTDESFWAEKGRGSWLNERRLRVSSRRDLADALI
ncbi:MAG: inositol monophosphatase, partial [Acidobacteria bacterium]|nr:inositol monophosphatase [Acidobacteriota bacterium]